MWGISPTSPTSIQTLSIFSHTFVVGPAYRSLRTQPILTLGTVVERLPLCRSFVSASAPNICPSVGPLYRRRHRTSAPSSVLRIGVGTGRLSLRRFFVSASSAPPSVLRNGVDTERLPSAGLSYRRRHRTSALRRFSVSASAPDVQRHATFFLQNDGRRRRLSNEETC